MTDKELKEIFILMGDYNYFYSVNHEALFFKTVLNHLSAIKRDPPSKLYFYIGRVYHFLQSILDNEYYINEKLESLNKELLEVREKNNQSIINDPVHEIMVNIMILITTSSKEEFKVLNVIKMCDCDFINKSTIINFFVKIFNKNLDLDNAKF